MAVPNHKQTVEAVRPKYGVRPSKDQCVELCNEVAWIHRGEGFGIAEKTGGTHGNRHDGQPAAIDGLVYRPPGGGVDQFIDILGNADGSDPPWAVPSWKVYDTSNRKWIAPISPTSTPPDPPPDPPPTGDYVTKNEFTLYKLQTSAALKDVTDDLSELKIAVGELEARVAALEAAPPGMPRDFILVPDDTAPAVNTSNAFYHSHTIRARAVPKPIV